MIAGKHSIQILYFLLPIYVGLIGCTSTPPKFELTENYPAPVLSSELNCAKSDPNHCAISSPIQDLADKQVNTQNRVTILAIGEQALEARIHMIRAARETIEIQTYIWANDETGNLLVRELMAAARRGVKVRVIADQLLSIANAENAAKLASFHKNISIQLYNPLQQRSVSDSRDIIKTTISNFNNLNHRMHNKVMVFDGRVGIVGGRNIENKYFDYDLHFNFIDRDVLVIGPVAQDMVKSFNEYWDNDITVELHQLHDVHEKLFSNGIQNLFGELALPDLGLFDKLMGRSADYEYINIQFVETSYVVDNIKYSSDHPEKAFLKNGEAEDQTIQDLTNIIDHAKTSLLMQTPYFVLSNPAYKFFLKKHKQNPEFKYTAVTNSLASNDHYVVYALSFKRKKRNVKNLGFQIHEMKPVPNDIESLVPRYRSLVEVSDEQVSTNISKNMSELTEQFQPVQITEAGPRFSIHAKTLVVDSSIAIIGSHNFDPRSLKINTESTLIIYDINFAKAVQENIEIITAPQNSWVIAKRQKVPVLGQISGILENISRLLPVFDLWPFRYTSSFELLEGKTPVAITHPDFYQHYRDVGQFPQTAMGDRQLRTYMVSGFGAIAEPQM